MGRAERHCCDDIDWDINVGAFNNPQVIQAGQLSTHITAQALEDSAVEGDENFFINILPQTSGVTVADGSAVGTVIDNDVAPVDPLISNLNNGLLIV
jgi:hypothetical protein